MYPMGTSTRAAIYCRISQDREGAGLGVARQEADCRALCERKGWDVVAVYPDNDVSAYSGAPRPQWDLLLEAARGGAVDAVVCWHVDRLTRSPRELEDVIDLADRHGLELATVTGEIDLATPTGRMIARMLGAAARHEAEHKAERQKRQRRQAAEAGKVSGGGTRPTGYESDGKTIRASEGEHIREAARRALALALESLSSICRDFHERGILNSAGKPYKPDSLRKVLISARISGRREHRPRSARETTRALLGEIVADAVWPGIISAEDSDKLRTLLTDPARGERFRARGEHAYFLSGIFHCCKPKTEDAACGWSMCGRPRSGVPRYVCPPQPGTEACGGVAVNAERAEAHVRDMVLAALASEAFMARLSRQDDDPGAELLEEIRLDEEDLEELAADLGNRRISRKEWVAARAPIEARLERNRTRLSKVSHTSVLRGFVGTYEDMQERWKALNGSQRRAIVSACVRRIDVRPSNPRKKWDPDRFIFDWIA